MILIEATMPLNITQTPEVFGAAKGKPHLFQGLALGRGPRTRIPRLQTAAGESHMTRPRVSRPRCTLDEQEFCAHVPLA